MAEVPISRSVADGENASTVAWTAHFPASGASDEEGEAVTEGIFDTGLDAPAAG
jgi:hypothetical protein